MAPKGLSEKLQITRSGLSDVSSVTAEGRLPPEDEVDICRKWLSEFAKQQSSLNENAHSYVLKHRVERWAQRYVSNGAFIQAAIDAGFRYKRVRLNAMFYMKVLPKEEWKRVKPKDFSKWLFQQVERNDVVADLAGDASVDETWTRTADRFYEFWVYLESQTNNESVMMALDVAWEEYSGSPALRPDLGIMSVCEAFYDGDFDIISLDDEYADAEDGKIYIYVLFEENELGFRKVRYVGQTKSPSSRIRQHILAPGTIEKLKWIGKLVNDGKCPLRMREEIIYTFLLAT